MGFASETHPTCSQVWVTEEATRSLLHRMVITVVPRRDTDDNADI
jgi:hypothetical protein